MKPATSATDTWYYIQAIRHSFNMLTQTNAAIITGLITSYPCTAVAAYPHTKSLKRQAQVQLHVKVDIPADLQVGAYSAVVYTTEIILALARVSQATVTAFYGEGGDKYSWEQSWGASQLPQCNTFMGAGLDQWALMSAGKHRAMFCFVLLLLVIIYYFNVMFGFLFNSCLDIYFI